MIGQHIGHDAAADQLREHVGCVTHETDAQGAPLLSCLLHEPDHFVETGAHAVEVTGLQPPLDACRVDVHAQEGGAVHRGRQRLGAAHAAETGGEDKLSGQRAPEVSAGARGECFIRSLQDALRADVDPTAGRHLPVHGQAHLLQPAKFFPGRPLRDEQAVGNQHARRQFMRPDNSHRLARLHE